MNTNAYSEPVLWRKSPLPHHATSRSSVSAEAAIEFGRFRVLLRRPRLLADGVPVDLGTRAFDLLLVLIGADGALVTKEELLSGVWPSMVVSEENLKVQISALRKALGADRDLICTEFGRGYRFIGILRSSATAIRRAVSANPACHRRHRLFAVRVLPPPRTTSDRCRSICSY
jgi:DNA-binding winged helix-turn-helix (wHTH) protein